MEIIRIISIQFGGFKRMKRSNGVPQEIIVKNKFGETIDVFESIDRARQKYYPDKSAAYLSAKMYHLDSIMDNVLGLNFIRSGDVGRTHNQKSYRVKFRKTGKEKIFDNVTKMFHQLPSVTSTSFYKQLKRFNNFKSDLYEIYPI